VSIACIASSTGALSRQLGKKPPLANLPACAYRNITTGKERTGRPVAERPVAFPPEFEERVMLKIRAYNTAAAIGLADYAARAHCLRRGTADRMTATQEAVAHSRALITNIDTLLAEFTRQLTSQGWLWPAHRSAPSEPEMEAELLEAELLSAAHWRDSAQKALVRAETMRDADGRRMMREVAMHYENLAAMVENANALQRQDEPGRLR
jgi:hypothetical protein